MGQRAVIKRADEAGATVAEDGKIGDRGADDSPGVGPAGRVMATHPGLAGVVFVGVMPGQEERHFERCAGRHVHRGGHGAIEGVAQPGYEPKRRNGSGGRGSIDGTAEGRSAWQRAKPAGGRKLAPGLIKFVEFGQDRDLSLKSGEGQGAKARRFGMQPVWGQVVCADQAAEEGISALALMA